MVIALLKELILQLTYATHLRVLQHIAQYLSKIRARAYSFQS